MPDYELSDISAKYQQEANSVNGSRRSDVMYVSTAKAFILVLLALAIAVGVGIIVHFAGPGKTIECNCNYPTADGGNTGGTAAAIEQCKDWAEEGNDDICTACPNTGTAVTCPTTATTTTKATTHAPTTGTHPGTTEATTMTTTAPPKITDVRLPLSLNPLLYTVELQPHMYVPDPEDFYFNGSLSLKLECVVNTNNITLHSNKLNISDGIKVYRENDMIESLYMEHSFDLDRQFLVIMTTQELQAGNNYIVEIPHFRGPLLPDLAGLYLSSYSRNNETIYIATTQMQPTDARKTFPCMDEPAIKAEFEVTLVRKSHMKSISNMPIDSMETRYLATSFLAPSYARKVFPCFDEPAFKAPFDIVLLRKTSHVAISNMPVSMSEIRFDDWVADKFQTTAKMSTYLLAFIICDFEYKENVTTNNVTYRAWARPEAVNQAEYSLEIGVHILDYFEEYFNVSYPLPKQDMIAIPDFAAGAMENWGLITYRETAMLYEPGVSSAGNKQRVAVVVSHELAHQWFGNLVTPSWWDDLWLNEGFASYVEYMGVDNYHKDWKMFDQFVIADLQSVFDFDGLISSHPVYVPVAHPDEINEIFDRISYAKGASIIRMMRFFLGDSVFQKGLTNYLIKLEYGAAFHDDLWYALGNESVAQNHSIKNVKEVMDTWVLQMNYPVMMVQHTRDGQISVTQHRYLQDPNAPDPGIYTSPFNYTWNVPFTMTTNNNPKFNVTSDDIVMLERNTQPVTIMNPDIPAPDGTNWVIGNPMQYGYYRVNYDEQNWNALIKQLRVDHEVIHPINRAQIINDAWSLAGSGELDMKIALGTTEYLNNEREYVPWSAATSQLGYVNSMLARNSLYGSFVKFIQNKTTKAFEELTMNNTEATHLQSYMRSTISGLACSYGIMECIDSAKDLYKKWMDTNINPIDPGLKSTVYCTAIAEGGIEEWEFALNKYLESNVAAEQSRLLSAMACTKQTWILSRYLEMSISENEIRKQDSVSVIIYISRNTIGRSLTWDFFREQWDHLLELHTSALFVIAKLVSGVTKTLNSPLELDQLRYIVFRAYESCWWYNKFIKHTVRFGPGTEHIRILDGALSLSQKRLRLLHFTMRYGQSFSRFSKLIGTVTSRMNTLNSLVELKAFIDSKENLGSGARAFEQALEKTQSNINWMNANVPVIQEWLHAQGF